jgi:hypothetical protein
MSENGCRVDAGGQRRSPTHRGDSSRKATATVLATNDPTLDVDTSDSCMHTIQLRLGCDTQLTQLTAMTNH